MIFEGKSVVNITDDEIIKLVSDHIMERQHLEYKKTVKYSEHKERIEILHDIISFANGGGGYIVIGIRDDGKGHAQKFESDMLENRVEIKQAIMSLCQDYIRERIEGLEVIDRQVDGNQLVIVRIPESARKPHMVIYHNRTDFYTRYQDGKRAMTIGEIREIFNKDYFGIKLSNIESRLEKITIGDEREYERQRVMEKIKSGIPPKLVTITNGDLIHDISYQNFVSAIGDKPFFRIAISPQKTFQSLIDLDGNLIRDLIRNPPGSRADAWNMAGIVGLPRRFEFSILRGERGPYRHLELFSNGHMEFWSPLDKIFCWMQSEEEYRTRPRLYPYPVIEYPTTFLRLYRAIVDALKIKDDFILSFHYNNLKGFIVRPYSPRSFEFMEPHSDIEAYQKDNFFILSYKVTNVFKPDRTAYDLVSSFYAEWDFNREEIPFYNRDDEKFVFSS